MARHAIPSRGLAQLDMVGKPTCQYVEHAVDFCVCVKHGTCSEGLSFQDSSKGGAVDTGCSGLHYIIGSFTI